MGNALRWLRSKRVICCGVILRERVNDVCPRKLLCYKCNCDPVDAAWLEGEKLIESFFPEERSHELIAARRRCEEMERVRYERSYYSTEQ